MEKKVWTEKIIIYCVQTHGILFRFHHQTWIQRLTNHLTDVWYVCNYYSRLKKKLTNQINTMMIKFQSNRWFLQALEWKRKKFSKFNKPIIDTQKRRILLKNWLNSSLLLNMNCRFRLFGKDVSVSEMNIKWNLFYLIFSHSSFTSTCQQRFFQIFIYGTFWFQDDHHHHHFVCI